MVCIKQYNDKQTDRSGSGRCFAASLFFVMTAAVVWLAGCGRGQGAIVLTEPPAEMLDGGTAGDVPDMPEKAQDVPQVIVPDGSTDDAPDSGEVIVHVCGAVAQEGVYRLPAGARICDAVEAAGGLAEAADSAYLNQAARLADGMQLYIPTAEETKARGGARGIVPEAPAERGASGPGVSSAEGRININTASAEQLTALPGIGSARAADIVAYRSAHGSFARTEDLKAVPGIGNAVYAGLADRICAE